MIDYSAEVSGWHQCHQQTMQLKHYNVWLFTVCCQCVSLSGLMLIINTDIYNKM